MKRPCLLVLMVLGFAPLMAQNTVAFVDPIVSDVSESDSAAYKKAFRDSLANLGDNPDNLFQVQTAAAKPSAGKSVMTIISGGSGNTSLILQYYASPDAVTAQKYFTVATPGETLPLLMTRAFEALLRPLRKPTDKMPAPILIDDFSPSSIRGTDLPVDPNYLLPYGLALRSDGHLFAACWGLVLEMDSQFRVLGVPTKKLNDEGNSGYAAGLSLTPGGTLVVRSLSGSDVYTFADGSPDYRRLRFPLQTTDILGSFADGSLFLVSPQQKKATIYQGKNVLTLGFPDEGYLYTASAGPENTLWVADSVSGAVKITFLDGKLKDVIFPELAAGSVVMKLRVLDDGSFYALTNSDLRYFSRNGNLLWTYDGKDDFANLNFSTLFDLAADRTAPYFFAVDVTSKKILRFWNPAQPLSNDMKKVAELQKELRRHPDKTELNRELAAIYTQATAPELAASSLDSYVADFPGDSKAQEEKLRLQVSLLKNRAKASADETKNKLKAFGPETARDTYSRTMKTLETLQSLVPDDNDVRVQKAALRTLFAQAEGQDSAPVRPLPQISSVELGGLFPSLMQVYLKKPAGKLVVKNTLTEPLKNVRVDFFLKKYMDFPAQGKESASVAPGESVSLDLPVVLNQSTLDLQEDVLLQAQLTLKFTTAQGPQELELSRPVTLYRKTALTWDVTAKLASFITPNEETIDLLSHRLVQNRPESGPISPAFLRALTICSALGALPLHYVPDPNTPISEILGNGAVVDTVRFPRTTLLYEGGDCSDTTALTASLFESVGLATAILTTPGHVFLAFDSGEKAESSWLFQAPGFETLVSGGKVWIPVESTVLAKGFTEAWRTASALVKTYKDTKDLEFIPVQGIRSLYPPLPLPPSTIPARMPGGEETKALENKALGSISDDIFQVILKGLNQGKSTLTGRNLSKQNNRIALFLTRYAHFPEASALYQSIVAADPTYIPAYVNWANLNLATGNYPQAASIAQRAKTQAPDSAAVNFLNKQIALQGRGQGDQGVRAAGETDLNWMVE